MPPQPQQNPVLSQVSLDRGPSGGGGSSGNALIQSVAQQMAQDAQKSIANMQKLAQESVQVQQQTAQQVAGGVAEALNQVVRGQQAVQADEDRKQQRAEDRIFQEDMARLQQEMAKEMQREATRVAQQIQGQRDAVENWLVKYETESDEAKTTIAEGRTQLDDLLNGGYFDQFPDGIERYTKMKNQLRAAEAMRDDHFNDDNIANVRSTLNETINDIIRGRPASDLSQLRVDPFLVPNPQVKRPGRPTPNLNGEQMFELGMTDGYPEGGILFGDNPYEGSERSAPMVDPELMRELMFYDATLTQLTDDRTRRQMKDMLTRTTVETGQRITPMMQSYRDFNKVFLGVAPNAVQNAVNDFTVLKDPRKFQNLPRTMFALAIRSMFEKNGDQMASLALDIFEGREKMDTTQEFYMAAALESAAFNVSKFISDEILTKQTLDKEGRPQGVASELVDQMRAQIGDDAVKGALGLNGNVDLTKGPGIVLASQAMQRQLVATKSYAERVAEGFSRSGVLGQWKRALGKTFRMGDVLAMHSAMQDAEDAEAVEQILNRATDQAVATLEPGEVPDVTQPPELKQTVNFIDAYIELARQAGPDQLAAVSSMLTGGAADEQLTSPNFPGYRESRKTRGGDGTYRDRMTKYIQDNVARRAAKKAEREQKAKEVEQAKQDFGVAGGALKAGVQKAKEVGKNAAEAGQALSLIPGITIDAAKETGKFLFGEKTIDFVGEGFHRAALGAQLLTGTLPEGIQREVDRKKGK